MDRAELLDSVGPRPIVSRISSGATAFILTMTDTLTPIERSRVMRAVKSNHTTPELVTRRILHALGCRYRLHSPRLPGKPDIVLVRRRKIVEVRGCFWHGHHC